jgi:hypothetical protein
MAYAFGPTRPDERPTRIFARRRGRRGLLVAALALLALAGGALAVYRLTTSPTVPAAGEVPLIRADGQPTRKRPDAPGGMEIAGQGTLALDGGQGAPGGEHLLPEPEAPLPRPSPPAVAMPPPPAAPAVAVPEPPPLPPSAAPPAAAPTVATAPAPAVLPAAPPASKPAAAAPAPALAHPQSSAAKGYRLQLGAVRDPAAAKQAWERLRQRHADLLGRLGFTAERVDLGGRGVFYRIQAGPLADGARAERDCQALKRRGVSCLLVRP